MSHIILCFPGQGAQHVGMGRATHDRSPVASALWRQADELLGFSLSRLAFEGPEAELTRTDVAQCAIYVTSVAEVLAREAAGVFSRDHVVAAAGLSLGEYTALWSAGVFSFEAGLALVRRRGVAMQAASDLAPSGMVSLVGADFEVAEKIAAAARGDEVLVVANLNAPGQVVLSGHKSACARVPEVAKEFGVRRAIALSVAGAFHSPLMAPAKEDLAAALKDTDLSAAAFPIWSNVDAAPTTDPRRIRDLLASQVVSPVLWEETMKRLVADGHEHFVEAPPGRVLAGLMKKIAPGAAMHSLEEGNWTE